MANTQTIANNHDALIAAWNDRTPATERRCWTLVPTVGSRGYSARMQEASYELLHGFAADGRLVTKCRRGSCFNPLHIETYTGVR